MEAKAIVIDQLTKVYKNSDHTAVDRISLSIPKGSIYGLLGPNGAGKTTTIGMLCGLIAPTEGTVTIENFQLKDQLQEIKKIIGVVPQEIALYPTLTAFENLRYIGKMYGIKNELHDSIEKNLKLFGLNAVANKRVETFSGGMKRRINLIAGIMHSPKVLFLDEPTVGVDVQSRNVITEQLKELNQQGMTIIYTSHLMEEAENLCTDIAIIDAGKIVAQGKPKQMIKEEQTENLEQLFLKLTGKRLRDQI